MRYKFIWGIKSLDDFSECEANIYTMNDIEICYDKKKKLYVLDIETEYIFNSIKDECQYLKNCLKAFESFMDSEGYDKNYEFCIMNRPRTHLKAKSIEELYTNFRIFVTGYCALYENN